MDMNDFHREFAPKLEGSRRWDAFLGLAQLMFSQNRPILIVETGTIRGRNEWHSDGNSTLVWDWLIDACGGEGHSVDIDPEAVAQARKKCRKMQISCEDSVTFLRRFERAHEIDLLYLDSYDFHMVNQQYFGPISALHHAAELSAIYERLKPGCIIAVDDCLSPTVGKQMLIQIFFTMLNIQPIGQGYITAWKKP